MHLSVNGIDTFVATGGRAFDPALPTIVLLHGAGRNGKGVFLRTLMEMLGDYAVTADFSTFTSQSDRGGPRDDVANMRGRHLVSAQEGREGAVAIGPHR